MAAVHGSTHFEARADSYAADRPPYPQQLWERIRSTGLLQPGRRALDLGAGSGEATSVLVTEGLDVLAVEPGDRLASLLQARLPTVRVQRSTAEEMSVADATIDLAVAATSIHWMDLDVVLPKVHRALAPGGRLAVLRHVFGDDQASLTPFRERVQAIVDRRRRPPRQGRAEDADATAAAVATSSLFRIEDVCRYRWSIEVDGEQVRRLFDTFSDWTADEVEDAGRAVDRLGGRVTEHYSSWLVLAAPVAGALPGPHGPAGSR